MKKPRAGGVFFVGGPCGRYFTGLLYAKFS